jgi:valyl-tRNA synthetase
VPANVAAKAAAQGVLYVCLEVFLRLLAPLMPFIAEELWQRLPGRAEAISAGACSATVSLAPYPHPRDVDAGRWESAEAEARMELTMRLVKGIRSVKGEYNITSKTGAAFAIAGASADATLRTLLAAVVTDVVTLAQLESVTVLLPGGPPPPAGCAVSIIDDKISVGLNLKGQIDVAAEVARLEKKRAACEKDRAAAVKASQAPTFSKVPEAVRLKTLDAIERAGVELQSVADAIARFQQLA